MARLPVAALADPTNRMSVRHPSGHVGPTFQVNGVLIWGFTGGVLARLLEMGGWARPGRPTGSSNCRRRAPGPYPDYVSRVELILIC